MKSAYEILGVAEGATKEDLKAAHRRLVKMYHPDRNPDDPDARAKFDEVQRAYEELTNPTPSQKPTAHAWGGFDPFGFNGFGGFAEMRQQVMVNCGITIPDAITGCEVSVQLGGHQGEPKTIVVSVPAGVQTGMRMRVNTGDPAFANTDIFVIFHVMDTPEFRSEGPNIIGRLTIDAFDAMLGGEFQVNTIYGVENVVLPAGTQIGHIVQIAGAGLPLYQGNGAKGNMLVHIEITVPHLDAEGRAALEGVRKQFVLKNQA